MPSLYQNISRYARINSFSDAFLNQKQRRGLLSSARRVRDSHGSWLLSRRACPEQRLRPPLQRLWRRSDDESPLLQGLLELVIRLGGRAASPIAQCDGRSSSSVMSAPSTWPPFTFTRNGLTSPPVTSRRCAWRECHGLRRWVGRATVRQCPPSRARRGSAASPAGHGQG